MGSALWCHADYLAGDKFIALAFGLLYCPGDEFIGGHARGRGRTHVAGLLRSLPFGGNHHGYAARRAQASPASPRGRIEKVARKDFRRCGISPMLAPI